MSDDQHLDPYLDVVNRLGTIARATTQDQLDTAVPACPGWTARQTIAHLSGLAEDWVAGNLDDYGSDTWAGAQVSRFDGSPIDDVLDAWQRAAERFASLGPSPIGGTAAMWAFGDAVVHEADIRAVLAPGTRPPDDAVALGLKAGVARWRHHLASAGVAPIDLVASDLRTWRIGDPDATAEQVETTAYEVFRALYGRRSRRQTERWQWSCDPAPYLDPGLPFPFRWADTDLDD
ncbi:MAG: maleylpyruvate isomerase family mycothiol-dependent enzyme [Actinomycetota bacterium]